MSDTTTPQTTAFERPEPVLKPGVLYAAWDRYICGNNIHCCGQSALFTGVTIGGYRVEQVTQAEVDIWPATLGPMQCECGTVKASDPGAVAP